MALNPALFLALEGYGLENTHLEQLLAICERGTGRATWHIDARGFAKIEMTLFVSMRDSKRMRDLTQLLQKER